MSSQPAHDTLGAKPFWQVQSVYDPEGTGKDFAYTIGLHTRGMPELHIWARPSLGQDPGQDWALSMSDRGHVLNELAQMMVDGRLSVGDEVRREYDGGLASVTYRIDPPGDKEQLEAFGVPPGVDVLPVPWSLQRTPEGPSVELSAEAEDEARSVYAEALSGLNTGKTAPLGWKLPHEPSFTPDQRFGPLTPVVLARAAELWQADERTMVELLRAAVSASCGTSLSTSSTMAIAVARPIGRRRALEELRAQTGDLVDSLTEDPAARRRWASIVADFDSAWWAELDDVGRRNVRHSLARQLYDLTLGCLLVEAVADHAPPWLLLHARGPWLSGFRSEPVISDESWRAEPKVLESVQQLLAPLCAQHLTTVAGIHMIARRRGIVEAPGYGDLCCRLEGWALTSATSCPWDPVLAALPAWKELTRHWPGATVSPMPDLISWATCVASALTHRARLTAEDVRTLAVPYSVELPQLEEVLNSPL